MATSIPRNWEAELSEFNDRMVRHHLTPTWAYYSELVAKEPPVAYRPYLWKSELLWKVVHKSGELVDLERGGERRSFEVVNPDLRHIHGTTHTIGAALQLVQPGELAPPHRHLANAIRFIVKGRGSYTAVQGERLYMEERDLILTPTWTWHEHGNETQEPIVWVDALDYPFNKLMQLSFFQPGGPTAAPEPRPVNYTTNRVGLARPTWLKYPEEIPNVTYRWADTWKMMDALRKEAGSPYDGILFEYVNPFTAGSVLPTMACYAQLLRPGEHTKARRVTTSAVRYVLEGEGSTIVNGTRFDWGPGDFFMIPPWAWAEHVNGSAKDAVFFVMTDKPIIDTFKFWREEAYTQNGGHQRVTDTFVPLAWA